MDHLCLFCEDEVTRDQHHSKDHTFKCSCDLFSEIVAEKFQNVFGDLTAFNSRMPIHRPDYAGIRVN